MAPTRSAIWYAMDSSAARTKWLRLVPRVRPTTVPRASGFQYGAPRQRGNRVEVPTFIQFSDGKSVAISYIMQLKGSEWQAYDIVAEKISLVKNYAEQLRSIMQKQGFDGLIREMNEKITQMQAKSGR